MLCFRDMTFCSAHCLNVHCPRLWTSTLEGQARRWWGGDGAPVAFSDFSPKCPEYQPARPYPEPTP